MNYFSKLPNRLFLTDNDNKSLLKIIQDDKVLLVLYYLYTNTNRKNKSFFTLEHMILSCGYKLNRNKGKTDSQFKQIIIKLQELKILSSNINMNNISIKQYVECILDIDLSKNFIQLYEWEKDKIYTYNKTNVDNLKLLIYYCYLKARMYKRANNQELHKDTEMAESCYPTYKTISNDLGITDETIHKYNQILVDLDLIRYKNAGKYYYIADDTKTIKETPNFYVLCKQGWEEELEASIKHYKKEHRDTMVFTSRPYKNNNRHTNGFIGRIEYLESIGKATDKQTKKKNRLIEQRKIQNTDSRAFLIGGLFNKYNGMLLSKIYKEKGQVNNAEREYNLELSLELIDKNDRLLIDYEYYKWIMMNYKEKEHEYYYNCVKNHKNTY